MRWRWAAKVVPLQAFPFILSETRGSNFVGRQRSMGLEFYHQQYWGYFWVWFSCFETGSQVAQVGFELFR